MNKKINYGESLKISRKSEAKYLRGGLI